MLGAIRLYKCLEQIQKIIDNKELANLKQNYLVLIKEMDIFIKALKNFTNNINYPIDESLIETYEQLMKECDLNDNNSKSTEVTKNNEKGEENKFDLDNGNIEIDNIIHNNPCCVNNCIIL